MSAVSRPLPGVRGISYSLVDQLVQRPEGRARALPVVAALGPRGSGKTELLDEIQERCAGRVPVARVDFEELAGARPSRILTKLAFDLNSDVPQFGRIAFPRLWLCALVLAGNLNTGSRPKALAELNSLMRADRPLENHREKVLDLARLASETGGLPGWAPTATNTLLNGVNWVSRRRILRQIRQLSPGDTADPRDVLVDLSKKDQGSETERRVVDTAVFEAFLADLDQAFTGGLRRLRRTANCVVLLDNAHTSEGKAFLAALLAAREKFRSRGDHAVVITTSRAWNTGWNASWRRPATEVVVDHALPLPRTPAEAELDSLAGVGRDSWYLVALGRLGPADTGDVVAGAVPSGFAHRLTGGRPGAVRVVLDVLAEQDVPLTGRALRGLLAVPSEKAGGAALASVALRAVGQDLTAGQLDHLVTASAGRGLEFLTDAAVLRTDRQTAPRAGQRTGALYTFLVNNFLLEVERDEWAAPRTAIDPWLRRLLLHALAGRNEDDPLGWTAVHERCRDHHSSQGSEAGARYHDLALGDVTAAVGRLAPLFADPRKALSLDDVRSWLADLDLITSAPNRLAADVDPEKQVEDVLLGVPELEGYGAALPRLVASLWLAADPLGDPEGVLDRRIGDGYLELARHRGQGSTLLYDRAERYRA